MTIKAVGFDLDGTFLKTHVDYYTLGISDQIVCEKHGIPFSSLEFTTKKRMRKPIRDWLMTNGRVDEIPAIDKEIDDLLTSVELQFVDEAEPFPGSVECLDTIKSKGLKIGLLTRGSREYGMKALDVAGVLDRFDAVVGRDCTDYDDAKPSPKAMISFAKELGVLPSEILYLGDNRTDYYSARDAGASFIGVLSGSMDRESWNDEDPEMRVVEYAGDVVKYL